MFVYIDCDVRREVGQSWSGRALGVFPIYSPDEAVQQQQVTLDKQALWKTLISVQRRRGENNHRPVAGALGGCRFREVDSQVNPDVATWYDRQHGEVDFYINQMLTGHRCFRAYQYRIKLDNTEECPGCQTVEETAEHVFFTCIRFAAERNELERVCGGRITPENVVSYMLRSDLHWNAVKRFTTVVLKRLGEEERTRR
ncbi:uncharacterized protein, partial [Halyomorpha halys]|uniref:uncharacterized protein n=1 Tax=Halyomorpha halys TaxID=286706 RepID=UPI0034D37F56